MTELTAQQQAAIDRAMASIAPPSMTPEQRAAIDRAQGVISVRSAQSAPQSQGLTQGVIQDYGSQLTEAIQSGNQAEVQRITALAQQAMSDGRVQAGLPASIGSEARETLTDNLVGLDNGVLSTGETIARALNAGGESMTLGVVGDEATAAVRSLGSQTYDEALATERAREAEFREQRPGLAVAADIGGAIALPGVGAANWISKGATRGWQLARAGLAGGAAGAAFGFTEGEGGAANRAQNAALMGAIGGVFGASAPVVVRGLMNAPARVRALFQRAGERPSLEALDEAATAAYQAVDDSGIAFDGQDIAAMADRVEQQALTTNYSPIVDTQMAGALDIVRRIAGMGQTSISQLDRVRRALWPRTMGVNGDQKVLALINGIDDLIDSTRQGGELMDAARAAYRRYAQTQMLADVLDETTRQTNRNGVGGNFVNNLRRNVDNLLRRQQTARYIDDDLAQEMISFVNGDTTGAVLRHLGGLSPSRSGISAMANVGAAGATGGLSILGSILAMSAKELSERRVSRGFDALMDVTAGVSRQVPELGRNALLIGQAGIPAVEEQTRDLRNRLLPTQ